MLDKIIVMMIEKLFWFCVRMEEENVKRVIDSLCKEKKKKMRKIVMRKVWHALSLEQ